MPQQNGGDETVDTNIDDKLDGDKDLKNDLDEEEIEDEEKEEKDDLETTNKDDEKPAGKESKQKKKREQILSDILQFPKEKVCGKRVEYIGRLVENSQQTLIFKAESESSVSSSLSTQNIASITHKKKQTSMTQFTQPINGGSSSTSTVTTNSNSENGKASAPKKKKTPKSDSNSNSVIRILDNYENEKRRERDELRKEVRETKYEFEDAYESMHKLHSTGVLYSKKPTSQHQQPSQSRNQNSTPPSSPFVSLNPIPHSLHPPSEPSSMSTTTSSPHKMLKTGYPSIKSFMKPAQTTHNVMPLGTQNDDDSDREERGISGRTRDFEKSHSSHPHHTPPHTTSTTHTSHTTHTPHTPEFSVIDLDTRKTSSQPSLLSRFLHNSNFQAPLSTLSNTHSSPLPHPHNLNIPSIREQASHFRTFTVDLFDEPQAFTGSRSTSSSYPIISKGATTTSTSKHAPQGPLLKTTFSPPPSPIKPTPPSLNSHPFFNVHSQKRY